MFLALCIIQVLYYPFMTSPKTPEIDWWQFGPMAAIGFVYGLPVFYLCDLLKISVEHEEITIWLLTFLYSGVIYLGLKKFININSANAKNLITRRSSRGGPKRRPLD